MRASLLMLLLLIAGSAALLTAVRAEAEPIRVALRIDPYVGGSEPTLDHLVMRIECVAWQRARIDRAMLEGVSRVGWGHRRQALWTQALGLERYEQRHIRPYIDAQTQAVLIETYWPDGLLAARNAPDPRDARCARFRFIGRV